MSFPQVKYPYNPKIVRGFFKEYPDSHECSDIAKKGAYAAF